MCEALEEVLEALRGLEETEELTRRRVRLPEPIVWFVKEEKKEDAS